MSSAKDEYLRRLGISEHLLQNRERQHKLIGNLRLLVAIVALVVGWLAFRHALFSGWWLLLPALIFAALVVFHERLLRALTIAQRTLTLYSKGLARIEDRWIGLGQTGDRFRDPGHVYADDLDLFGRGGLFELLSVARTQMGEDCLARWLLAPSAISRIVERQGTVAELRDKIDFREQLLILGDEEKVASYPAEFAHWAEAAPSLQQPVIRWLAFLLAILAIASFFTWVQTGIAFPFLIVLVIEACLMRGLKRRMEGVTAHVGHAAAEDLGQLAKMLKRIELEPFLSVRMRELSAQLLAHAKETPSHCIARLSYLTDLLESSHNLFVRIIDVPLLYRLQVAFALDRWRSRYGKFVRRWLEIVAETEALSSLATYAYEHPEDILPEFLETNGTTALFEGEELGHPLIPQAECVRNTVRLGRGVKVLMVSGSNMSGKSTLLRVVGINTVMAMAGAPVRARKLILTALQAGTSMRLVDSLQEHVSHFYAEISRLRKLIDLDQEIPLLFLLDEILHGTNSEDRGIGAEGLIRTLIERGAIGLVTTHDLAITHLAKTLRGAVTNVHFQDHLEAGRISFDYKLRDGVVAKSNALELMRSIGLEV